MAAFASALSPLAVLALASLELAIESLEVPVVATAELVEPDELADWLLGLELDLLVLPHPVTAKLASASSASRPTIRILIPGPFDCD